MTERPGLQAERTALAWNRTGFALLGLAVVVVRLRLAQPGALAVATVAACAVLAGAVLVGGIRRYRAGRALADGRLPAAVVSLIVVLAAVELVAVLA